MKKILLLITICTAIVLFSNSCSTPPPEDAQFNYGSDDPYRQGQNLVEAIAHGANSAAYRLMERGAPLNYQDKKDEWTPLIYAIYHHNWRMAKVLIRAGVNVNLADNAGRSPLMWAALRNSGITATLLVEHGADINAVDISGRTALQYAIIYTNYTLAAYLAEIGRKPPAQRLRKEQFSRLKIKRMQAEAEASNMKLFGVKRKREVIEKIKNKEINKNIKVDKPAKTTPEKNTEASKLNKTSTDSVTPAVPEKDINSIKAVKAVTAVSKKKPVSLKSIIAQENTDTTVTPVKPLDRQKLAN